ncbi:MAG: hypothetical protein ABIN79_11665 [Marmoricola sp.]
MRLLLVELARFRSRRVITVLVLVAAVFAAVVAGVAAYDTRPLTQADRSEAAAQADLESERPELRTEVRACESDPTSYLGPDALAAECSKMLVPSAESYYPREQLDLGSTLDSHGLPLALAVAGLMVIIGGTFAGGDWASGSIATQLLFDPRRLRVWLAKAAAVTLSGAVVATVVLGGFWLALFALAEARGIAVSSATLDHVLWHVVRAVALATGAALGAFALTMVFRHTVATLALLFVYSVGGEIAVNLLPLQGAGRWSVGNNAYGWLATRHRYFDSTIECSPRQRCDSMQLMTHLEAGLFLGALLLLALLASVAWFRRSDV